MTAIAQRRQITEAPDEIPELPNYDDPIEYDDYPETGHAGGLELDTCSAAQTGAAGFGPPSRMMVRRSLSPDGLINSVTVEIDLSIDGLSAKEIRARGLKALELETQIARAHFSIAMPLQPLSLVKPKTKDNSGNGADGGEDLAAPARLLDIGKTKNGGYFINVKVGGKKAKLFGSKMEMVRQLAGIGQDLTPEAISEGLQLDFSCRAITKLSEDGRYLNVVRLLPRD